jgi:hypothetical protein
MTDSLNFGKELNGFATASTFYTRQSRLSESLHQATHGLRNSLNRSTWEPSGSKKVFNNRTLVPGAKGPEQAAVKPFKKPPSHASDKLKTLCMKIGLENRYNLFQVPKNKPQPVKFLPEMVLPEKPQLGPKDTVLKRLVFADDFSLRRLAQYLSTHFKDTYLKLDEVVSQLEGCSGELKGTQVLTAKQLIEALIPDNELLRGCLLAKCRSTGSYQDNISQGTLMVVAQALKVAFSSKNV